jgi:predicted amidohydrolase
VEAAAEAQVAEMVGYDSGGATRVVTAGDGAVVAVGIVDARVRVWSSEFKVVGNKSGELGIGK